MAGIIHSFGREESRKRLQNLKCNTRRKFLTFGEGQERPGRSPRPCSSERNPGKRLSLRPAATSRHGAGGVGTLGAQRVPGAAEGWTGSSSWAQPRLWGCRPVPESGRGQPLARAPEAAVLPGSQRLWQRWPRSARGRGRSVFGPRELGAASRRRAEHPVTGERQRRRLGSPGTAVPGEGSGCAWEEPLYFLVNQVWLCHLLLSSSQSDFVYALADVSPALGIDAAASLVGEEPEMPRLGLPLLLLWWKEPPLHREKPQMALPGRAHLLASLLEADGWAGFGP